MANHSVWKGFVSLGLLSIPVKMFTGARTKRIDDVHQYHTTCKTQIKQPQWCPKCEVRLEPTEVFKAYDAGDGIIQLTKEEIQAITPETERTLEIKEFVNLKDLDVVYFGESFYLTPEPAGQKAYSLLVRTLADTARVGIGQITKNGREHVVALRAKGHGIMAHYLWYADEVARVAEFEDLQPISVTTTELKLARQLSDSLVADFDPSKYEDGYRHRLTTLISSKLDDKIKPPAPVNAISRKPAVDITAALMESLKNKPKKDEPKPAGRKGKKVA